MCISEISTILKGILKDNFVALVVLKLGNHGVRIFNLKVDVTNLGNIIFRSITFIPVTFSKTLIIKLFVVVINNKVLQARVLANACHFHPRLIFAGMSCREDVKINFVMFR